ncbi:nucleolar protein 16 [Halyomorpha halys]|uniref:nucleolar protein 16 n=1 Tax=Halyomorpha halys TaxID=286706 RepID=UPI0006D4FF1A|nr:nucleolar protein 16-like [Halyomorpha halys]
MTKLRKQRKRKVYRFDVNRKRMRKKMNRLPNIQCDQLKTEWDKKKSTRTNLEQMGLVYDPNKNIKIPSNKPKLNKAEPEPSVITEKTHVVRDLEVEAKAPRQRNFKLPKSQVDWICKCIDKYNEDYEAMAKDRKLNFLQYTPNQLRTKINVFKSIPEQYDEYRLKKLE